MGYPIRYSANGTSHFGVGMVWKMVLASDGVTPATGKLASLAVELSKNQGTFGPANATPIEIGHGWYGLPPDGQDHDTLGPCILRATATDCDEASDVFDMVGTDLTTTSAESVFGQNSGDLAQYGDESAGRMFFNAFAWNSGIPGKRGVQIAPGGLNEYEIVAGISFAAFLRGMGAVLAGKRTISTDPDTNISTEVYKGIGEETVRVTALVNEVTKERISITLNLG